MTNTTKLGNVNVDGVSVFYREAGSPTAPVILLLHGFPSSSHQYRHLIPLLATKYRVVAPDIPGFGFTKVPEERKYQYTFASFAETISQFLDALKIAKFAVYIFDYGAPVGLRIALQRPEAITAIFSQNGNAYNEGFGEEFWAPAVKYWKSQDIADRKTLGAALLTFETTKFQYEHGTPADRLDQIAPETYNLDWALMSSDAQKEIQLDIFNDYRTNIELYPKFQEFFRTSKVPVLAFWGKNDVIFVPPGAEAFKRDAAVAEVHLLDAGHFILESNLQEVADLILPFAEKHIGSS